MAMAHELDPSIQDPKLSEQSKGIAPHGELIRDYEVNEGTKWRFGLPNYARVNEAYFKFREKKHKEGSLEAVVQKLVKNWEVESHHIADIHQWKTMDVSKFKAALNGGCPASAQIMAQIGPYNLLIGETVDYSSKANTFESANTTFSNAFNKGFAWEVTEVYSGPPVVAFKWRHFGEFAGAYTDKSGKVHKGDGRLLSVYGMCIAKVNDQLVIEELDVYWNPNDLLNPMAEAPTVGGGSPADDGNVVRRDEVTVDNKGAGCRAWC
jgi:hypothetical protein